MEFGTTGYTMDNIFVLYDRASDSVWYPTSNTSLEATSGTRRGQEIAIQAEPAPEPLGQWLDAHPDSTLLLPTAEDLERMEMLRNRPYMGVQLGERDGGLFLTEVMDGTPADLAGLESGDRLLSMAGTTISSREDLGAVISDLAIGDTVEVLVDRDGAERALSLTLGSRE